MLQVLCLALKTQFHFYMKHIKSLVEVTSEDSRVIPDIFWILVFLLFLLCIFFLFILLLFSLCEVISHYGA